MVEEKDCAEQTIISLKAEEEGKTRRLIEGILEELLQSLARKTESRITDIKIQCYGHTYNAGVEYPMVAVTEILYNKPISQPLARKV